MAFMKLRIQIFLVITFVLVLLGCKSKSSNPELLDPIFKDLSAQEKDSVKAVADLEKNQADNFKSLAEAGADGMSLKVARKRIRETGTKLTQTRQMAEYSRIRAERRRVEGRRSYNIAFEKGEEWPNPAEYQHYLANKRLRQAPRNWSSRVPKPGDRIATVSDKK